MHFRDGALGFVDLLVQNVCGAAVDVDWNRQSGAMVGRRFQYLQTGFMGILRSLMDPYFPKISRI